VTYFKLLGVVICSDLSWHAHATYILQKVSKRMFWIINLARAGILSQISYRFIDQVSALFSIMPTTTCSGRENDEEDLPRFCCDTNRLINKPTRPLVSLSSRMGYSVNAHYAVLISRSKIVAR
jgi:hypothetical protein